GFRRGLRVLGAMCARCAWVDASTTRSEAWIRSSSDRNGAGERSPLRNRPAFSLSRAVAAASFNPGIPSSSARQTARPIAPRPAMPTFMVTHVIMPAGGGMTSARTLREPLEHLYRDFDYTARVEFDAIRFPRRRSRCCRAHRPRARALRAELPRGRPARGVSPRTLLARLPSSVPSAVGGRPVQAAPSLPPLDGPPRAARLRPLDRGLAGAAPDPGGHPRREHLALDRSDAPEVAQLADGRGDHAAARGDRPGGSRAVRRRALP